MANRFYLISSFFFLGGSITAILAERSPVNWLYLLGSIFFFFAAVFGVTKRNR